LKPSDIQLQSGGAAFSDHLAVRLYLEHLMEAFDLNNSDHCFKTLTLWMPCAFQERRFADTGSYDWKANPGKIANRQHDLFSKLIKHDSFKDLACAKALGAEFKEPNTSTEFGFH